MTLTFDDGYDGGYFKQDFRGYDPLISLTWEGDDAIDEDIAAAELILVHTEGDLLAGWLINDPFANFALEIYPDLFYLQVETHRPDFAGDMERYEIRGISNGFVRVPEPAPWMLLALPFGALLVSRPKVWRR